MGFDDCYQLGYIQKTHGLKGSVIVSIDADYPEDYENLESVLLNQNGSLVPFFISDIAIRKQGAQIAFEDVDTIEQAAQFIGTEIWLPLESLPKLGDGQYYFHDLIGFNFYDGNICIGKVTQVYQMSNTNLLAVDHEGIEVLVPMQDEIMGEVDSAQQKIVGNLPDGLLKLYLDEQ